MKGNISRGAVAAPDFQNVAGAEILHRDHFTECGLVARHRRQADKVSVIESVVFRDGRELFARDIEIDVAQRFGRVAIVNAFKLHDEVILGETRLFNFEMARSVLGFERAVGCEVGRLLRERTQAHFALESMRGADLRHADSVVASAFRTRDHALARGRSVGLRGFSLGCGFLLRSRCCARGLGGFFRGSLALLARDRLFRIVALLALHDTGGVEETLDAIGRLRALGDPALHLVHVELEALGIVLRQQRIEEAETLDEAAVTRRAVVGGDDVIDRALLGAGAGHSEYDGHW